MVNLKKLIVVGLAMLGNACMTDYDTSRLFQVTDDFNDEQYAILQREAAHLCEINDGRCIELTREDWPNKITIGDLGAGTTGRLRVWSDGLEIMTIKASVIDRGRLVYTFRHEMGHAAGCRAPNYGHSVNTDAVMYPHLRTDVDVVEWTQEDLDCINRAW